MKIESDNMSIESLREILKQKELNKINGEEKMKIELDNISIESLREILKQKELDDKSKTFADEIKYFPERFERLTIRGWETINSYEGVSNEGNSLILNSHWNHSQLNDKVYYVEFEGDGNKYKELIQRKVKKNER